MSHAASGKIKVQQRTWINPHTNERTPVIVVKHGPVFVRIPIEQAYEVVHKIHDLTEEYEAEQSRRSHHE